MKSYQSKNSTSTNFNHLSFFQKENSKTFFAKNNKPFFNALPIQAKLTVNQPNDIFEQEADAMANKAVQGFNNSSFSNSENNSIDFFNKSNRSIQRKCAACEEEEKLLRKESFSARSPSDGQTKTETALPQTVSSSIAGNLNSSNSSGNPLQHNTRKQMESSFGADFSHVRIHNDNTAAQMSKDLNAQAFTHGSDIYFNSGKYDANNKEGQHLLAHELTHVVQQGAQGNNYVQRYSFSPCKDKADAEKESQIKQAMDNTDVLFQRAIRSVQSILINGEKETNKFAVQAVKAFFHCPAPADMQLILSNLKNLFAHFKGIETVALLCDDFKNNIEAEYDDILNTLFIRPDFFNLSAGEKVDTILFRIIWPLYMDTTFVVGKDFTDFSFTGDQMVRNAYSMEYFTGFFKSPHDLSGIFGQAPCWASETKPSETNLNYTNTGIYVIVPKIVTDKTHLKIAAGFETAHKGDIVGELLSDRFGRFIFYKDQRIYVDKNNDVIFPY